MVRSGAETLFLRSDAGAVEVTSVTTKHSKQIWLRVSFSHIFLKWNTRFCPSTYIPPPVTGGTIGDHFESVIENLMVSLWWTRYLRLTGHRGKLNSSYCSLYNHNQGNTLSHYKVKNSGMKWESSADKIHSVQCRPICGPCGKSEGKTEWKSLEQLCGATCAPAADRRTFFSRDGVAASLLCSVSTLDIQLEP